MSIAHWQFFIHYPLLIDWGTRSVLDLSHRALVWSLVHRSTVSYLFWTFSFWHLLGAAAEVTWEMFVKIAGWPHVYVELKRGNRPSNQALLITHILLVF